MRLPSPSETAAQGEGSGASSPSRWGNSKADAYGAATANGTASIIRFLRLQIFPLIIFAKKYVPFAKKYVPFAKKYVPFAKKCVPFAKKCVLLKNTTLYISER